MWLTADLCLEIVEVRHIGWCLQNLMEIRRKNEEQELQFKRFTENRCGKWKRGWEYEINSSSSIKNIWYKGIAEKTGNAGWEIWWKENYQSKNG